LKQADIRNIFKKASKGVRIATIVLSHNALYPTPSPSSAMKTPENRRRPWWPWISRGKRYTNV